MANVSVAETVEVSVSEYKCVWESKSLSVLDCFGFEL